MRRFPLDRTLFLDIETVPQAASYKELDGTTQALWEEKTQGQRKDEISAEDFYERAGLMAEFGRIVCISVGFFNHSGGRSFRLTSFHGEEGRLLMEFKQLLDGHYARPDQFLCGHNGKGFDFPYIARRMVIHGMELPDKLDLYGKKPWEVPHLDTMELWRFGDFKHYVSLKLLAHVLGIPSPKEEMDGSMVRKVFHEQGDIDRIVEYCERDVLTTAQVMLRLQGDALLTEGEIKKV